MFKKLLPFIVLFAVAACQPQESKMADMSAMPAASSGGMDKMDMKMCQCCEKMKEGGKCCQGMMDGKSPAMCSKDKVQTDMKSHSMPAH